MLTCNQNERGRLLNASALQWNIVQYTNDLSPLIFELVTKQKRNFALSLHPFFNRFYLGQWTQVGPQASHQSMCRRFSPLIFCLHSFVWQCHFECNYHLHQGSPSCLHKSWRDYSHQEIVGRGWDKLYGPTTWCSYDLYTKTHSTNWCRIPNRGPHFDSSSAWSRHEVWCTECYILVTRTEWSAEPVAKIGWSGCQSTLVIGPPCGRVNNTSSFSIYKDNKKKASITPHKLQDDFQKFLSCIRTSM